MSLGYHGVELDSVWSKFTWRQKLQYYWWKFFLERLYCMPVVRQVLNELCLKVMKRVHLRLKRAPGPRRRYKGLQG